MDVAFTSITPLHLQNSFVRRSVCARPLGNASRTFAPSTMPCMVGSGAPIATESEALPEKLTGHEGGEALLEDDNTVSVIDIDDDTEYDFDESEIIPCLPPQPVLNAQAIAAIRSRFRLHDNDSGSPEYQIASLTAKISYLTEHLKKNRKDHSSTRGLIGMVSKRRKLLKYVKREDPARFDRLVKDLNIRVSQELRRV